MILEYYNSQKDVQDLRSLAYILATSYWETWHNFLPIEEVGKGKGRKYGLPDKITKKVYYGRGHVQLTWKENYERFGRILGIDLVNNPELALDKLISIKIMFIGMSKGRFTGRDLDDYFNSTKEDWFNARRIINGTDKAKEIATIAKNIHNILKISEV